MTLVEQFHAEHKARRQRIADSAAAHVRKIEITANEKVEAVPIARPSNVISMSPPVVRPYLIYHSHPEFADIIGIVSKFYDVSETEIASSRRSKNVVRVRHITEYLCRELTLKSLPEIGRSLGNRDHTSIMFGVEKITALLAVDARLNDEITLLRMKVADLMTARNAGAPAPIEWRRIPSASKYLVSSDGRIRHVNAAFAERKLQKSPRGYFMVNFWEGRKLCIRSVHSLVAEAFHGPRPDGMQVRHLDGNPSNNNAANLAYGTPKQNAADRIAHGRNCHGEKNGNSSLRANDVERIRLLHQAGDANQYELAEMFGISQAQINNIVLYKQWRRMPRASHVD